MKWDGIKSMLASTAPLIGGAIGGPGGSLVASWIASELGDDVDPSDPTALENAIKADPEALFKLKELEAKHKEELQRMGLEAFKAEVADKDSARAREMAVVQATGKRDIFVPMLAFSIILGFFGILVTVLIVGLGKLGQAEISILNIMLGFLGGAFASVVGYYFGSSQSSANKDKNIALKK
jgi:hypothetical protein